MPETVSQAADRLANRTRATALVVRRWRPYEVFATNQLTQVSSLFGADRRNISASKKLINLRHPAYRSITKVACGIVRWWETWTLPYVERGVRLIDQRRLDTFRQEVEIHRDELLKQARELQSHRGEIMEEAHTLLKDLFRSEDYPSDLATEYSLEVKYPELTPPAYLREINPQEYERQMEAFRVRMEEVVLKSEQALIDNLAVLVTDMARRLGPDEKGEHRQVRRQSFDKLQQFFQEFKSVQIRQGSEIETLVRQADDILYGYEPRDLKEMPVLREDMARQLGEVAQKLDTFITPKTRRRLLLEREGGKKASEVPDPTPESAAVS